MCSVKGPSLTPSVSLSLSATEPRAAGHLLQDLPAHSQVSVDPAELRTISTVVGIIERAAETLACVLVL